LVDSSRNGGSDRGERVVVEAVSVFPAVDAFPAVKIVLQQVA